MAIRGNVACSLWLVASVAVGCASTANDTGDDDGGAYLSINGWVPSASVAARVEALADIGSREEVGEELVALPAEDRMTLLRAGLRSRDLDVASMCVHFLDMENHGIDFAESRRAADVIIESSFRGEGAHPLPLSRLLEFGNAEDMDEVYERLLEVDDTEDGNRYLHIESGIEWLHKLTWGKHIPILVRLLNRHDGPIADACYQNLLLAIAYSDRNRQRVARCLLRENNSPLIPNVGVDPGLAGMVDLVYWYPTEIDSQLLRMGTGWVRRWLVDGRLDEGASSWLMGMYGRSLMAKVGRTTWREDLLPLRRLDDEASIEFLRELAETDERAMALGILAMRGDEAALEWLANQPDAEEADGSGYRYYELDLLFAANPERGRARLAELLLAPQDETTVGAVLRQAQDIVEDACLWGLRPRPSWFDGFEDRVIASTISGERMARIGGSVPGCRTRRLAREAVRRIEQDPRDLDRLESEHDHAALAFLETSAASEWRSVLRAWAFGNDASLRRFACRVLLSIGDSESAEALVAWLRRSESEVDSDDDLSFSRDGYPDWTRLARSPGPASRAYLWEVFDRFRAADDIEGKRTALRAIGQLEGLPRDAPLPGEYEWGRGSPALDGEEEAALLHEIETCLRDRRPVDAFVAVLRANPERGVVGAGSVRDPRVTEYLRELQRKRHLELYRYATAELAIQGDAAAREETWKAIRSGQYRWRDHLWGRQLTLGYDFDATLDGLVATLESNCCMRTAVEGFVLENLLDRHPLRSYQSAVTPVAETRLRLAFHDDFAWSWTAGHFVSVER